MDTVLNLTSAHFCSYIALSLCETCNMYNNKQVVGAQHRNMLVCIQYDYGLEAQYTNLCT